MAMPKQSEVNTIETEPVAPTEAKASAPIKCPTIILSTMINDCCKIVPNISGMANDKSNLVGLPVVIFVCLLIPLTPFFSFHAIIGILNKRKKGQETIITILSEKRALPFYRIKPCRLLLFY